MTVHRPALPEDVRLHAYDYDLPLELIAQRPIPERDAARLLVLERATGVISHRGVRDLSAMLRRGDLLVLNDSRVIPARLRGRKSSGGAAEVLLIRQVGGTRWQAMTRPGLKVGQSVRFSDTLGQHQATVEAIDDSGFRLLCFEGNPEDVDSTIHRIGEMPTPPYVRERLADRERYQTIYARPEGSVAAPTAGLHFTRPLLDDLRNRGVETAFVTLHVGPGTFQPVKASDVREHRLFPEWAEVSAATAAAVNRTKAAGRRVVAVGTTTVRTLESAAREGLPVRPRWGDTGLFIYPPFRFCVVDALLTNFHLPRSTLLMLVSAFAGRERVLAAYAEAIRERYRFYSFGDAMLVA